MSERRREVGKRKRGWDSENSRGIDKRVTERGLRTKRNGVGGRKLGN